jgi:diketogulonate reductase-like aldo/keto reductase
MLGLGAWGLRGHACKQAVKEALSLEYTHIDTAWMYENQGAIGDALKEAGAARGRLFITSKVWRTDLHYDGVLAQCEETLRDLQTAYVDLFLIHAPSETVSMAETFKALKRLFEERKVRSVGVSNFTVVHLEEAQSVSEVPIRVNQIKYHPGEEKRDVLRWCQEHNVVVTAHTPLGRGRILGVTCPHLCVHIQS